MNTAVNSLNDRMFQSVDLLQLFQNLAERDSIGGCVNGCHRGAGNDVIRVVHQVDSEAATTRVIEGNYWRR